jgi:beta-carotene 3-hydroxylase
MTEALVSIGVALVVAPLMELWSRFLHGRVWHGVLFSVHRSHHRERHGRFEANDLLSVTHAPIAATLIIVGCMRHGIDGAVLRGIGGGMTLFGVAYVIVHDGFVHGRLPVAWLARFRFFRRVRGAHRIHHRTGGAPYGLFAGTSEIRHDTAPASKVTAHRALARGPSARSTSR